MYERTCIALVLLVHTDIVRISERGVVVSDKLLTVATGIYVAEHKR